MKFATHKRNMGSRLHFAKFKRQVTFVLHLCITGLVQPRSTLDAGDVPVEQLINMPIRLKQVEHYRAPRLSEYKYRDGNDIDAAAVLHRSF